MAKTTGNPFFDMDLTKMLSEYKVPGVDMDSILASQRKNIEAVTAANQLAMEGLQAVIRRQAEIMRQSLEESSAMLNEVMAAGSPEDKAAKQADVIKSAFERALANSRELAELLAKSNTEAAEVLNKRFSDSLDELKLAIAKSKK